MQRSTLLSFCAGALFASTAAAQVFTPGNIVVLRVGDPTLTLGSTAAPVFLDEWDTTTNTLVQSFEIPNSQTNASPSFSQRGFSSSEGCLNLSTDGRYLIVAGYDRAIGDTDPSAESGTTTRRIIATVDTLTGLVDTTTQLADAYDGSSFRGAASIDGSAFWTVGNSSNGSVRYATLGASTSTDISLSPTNMRWIGIRNSQLYGTSASTGALSQGVLEVGTGLPTMAGQMTTLLPGFPTAGTFSDGAPYDFWFADSSTLYVADSASNGTTGFNCAGGVQKWELASGTWTRTWQISGFGADCVRGLTGLVRNGVAEIWFTAEPNGFTTSLFQLIDTGPNSVPQLITTEQPETDIRGVRVIGSTFARIPAGCGASSLQVQGSGLLGTDVEVEMVNAAGFPLINYSTAPLGLPVSGCSCTIVYDLGVLAGNGTISIPNQPALVGSSLRLQGLDLFDPNTTCVGPVPGLPLSLTDGIEVQLR
ncbi:MAG: hypothetical protein AB8H80_18325 [Planctomycetota bacterium]